MTPIRGFFMPMLTKIKMKIRGLFATKPTEMLKWTCKDYEMGKRWAKSQPHPYLKDKTLWEHVYDKRESTFTIDNINKYLFGKM